MLNSCRGSYLRKTKTWRSKWKLMLSMDKLLPQRKETELCVPRLFPQICHVRYSVFAESKGPERGLELH